MPTITVERAVWAGRALKSRSPTRARVAARKPPERGGGEHERDAERGRRAREQARALAPGERLHRPTVSIEISGGTRKRTGTMLVPMPGETKRSRSSSWMWPIA